MVAKQVKLAGYGRIKLGTGDGLQVKLVGV